MSEAPAAARTRGHPSQRPDVRLRTGWLRQANPPSPPAAGKAIVILCDGTSNDPEQMDGGERVPTNVFRLYQALTDPTQFGGAQIAWYDPGVGTDTSRVSKRVGLVTRLAQRLVAALPAAFPVIARKAQMLLEAATGASIRENIEQGYREIVRLYEPGDRIYLFGFSRGAYTARCIAGVIDRCGLLRRERLGSAAAAVSLYLRRPRDRRRGAPRQPLLDAGSIHPDGSVTVHVLGLWDTVAALGLPLWGWWFRIGELWRNKSFDSDPASVCEFVYHGLAMDETRSQFFPTLTTAREPGPHPRIRQLWFRGAHADVGGGYRERELSEIPLEWMLQVARHHGLRVRPVAARGGTAESGVVLEPRYNLPVCAGSGVRQELGEIHSEVARRPGWQAFGTWPRWTPALRPGTAGLAGADGATGFGLLHASVYARAEYAHWRWARRVAATTPGDPSPLVDYLMARDGMVFLDAGDSVRLRVLAAQPWNRSGVVFEQDALYSIAFVEGAWSAGGGEACGPEGTTDGFGGWLRRLAGGRRLELVGHIAHPRPWPVEEFSFAKLLRFVLIGDPGPLVQSLLPLGRCLGEAGARRRVYVVNLAENGLFHAFANAGWLAYDGHDGALDIRIARLDGPPPAGARLLAVTPKGKVLAGDAVPPELLAAVVAREQEVAAALPSWRRARDSWFGVPPADAAPAEPEPWSWRQATALEQGTTGEGFAFADPLAAGAADLPLPPAEAEGPAARRLRELKENYGREAERGEARWSDRLLDGLARLLNALPTGGGYDVTYTLGGGERGGVWKSMGDLKRTLGGRRLGAPRARKGMTAWKDGWDRGDI